MVKCMLTLRLWILGERLTFHFCRFLGPLVSGKGPMNLALSVCASVCVLLCSFVALFLGFNSLVFLDIVQKVKGP